MRKILLAVALAACGALKADTLWWMVNDSAFVDGVNMMTFCNNYPDTDDSWVGARVKATHSGGSTTLPVYVGLPDQTWADHAYVGYSVDNNFNPITNPSDPNFDWGNRKLGDAVAV